MSQKEYTKGQLYLKRFAYAVQRMRSIIGELLTEEEFECIFKGDFFVSEEALVRYRDMADADLEFDYAMLFSMQTMAQKDTFAGLRAVMVLVEMGSEDDDKFDATLKAKLEDLKAGKL